MAPTLLMLPIRMVAQTGIQNRGLPDGAWKLISAVAAEAATAAFWMMYIDVAQRSRSVLQEGNTQVVSESQQISSGCGPHPLSMFALLFRRESLPKGHKCF